MAKKLVYNGALGPDTVTFGAAGTFTKGEARIIEDDALAAQLLTKSGISEVVEAPAKSKTTTQEG